MIGVLVVLTKSAGCGAAVLFKSLMFLPHLNTESSFLEPWNGWCGKGQSTFLLKQGHPQVAQGFAQLGFEYLQGWKFTTNLYENEDFRKLAETEIASCEEEIAELKQQIALLLIPSEETDESDLVLEVTAGVGGQEAMLFTSEIFDMYQRYAAYKKWKFEVLEYFPSEIGGLRHAVASIAGAEAYKYMKFEGGVHRVQRVPKTEKQGRIHTSTMTVAILPQPTEMRLQISPKDLRIETKRASGAGGQHVNTTDSAVRIVHIPTGIVSECQQERSQIRNKEKAMQMLCAKLYNAKLEEETKKRNSARKIQIGTKGRSEKIRTYNFPQDRITDHRISRSVHHVESFMLGEEMLDEMIQTLREYADYESLLEIISENEKKNSS
uniref:Peptide chain release factor 1-like, mitochondrial n=1 Tax=Corvus moneduloides TaxID=1196302 RepID=A0A8C3DLJ0_CORMO